MVYFEAQMSKPIITANVSEQTLEDAKIAAVRAKKSLRKWAGEAIEEYLKNHRASMKRGPKLN